jgi:DNA-binding LacI/PurR family transcriptional regulator
MIHSGEITDLLPSERVLAERLAISRPVLRQTLAILGRQGIIEISHGRRTRILMPDRPSAPRTRAILVAGPLPVSSRAGSVDLIEELRQRLEAKGYTWTEFFDSRLQSPKGMTLLAERIAHHKPSCLLLDRSTETIQRWTQKQGVPSVVFGTTYPGINLPSIDMDYHALGWHAGGQFLKAGHRHIGLLLPRLSRRGDLASREGLQAYLQSQSHFNATVTSIEVGSQASEIANSLKRVMARQSAPTAFFSFKPFHTITLMTFLLQRGLRIPQDIAIISRDSEPCLEAVLPEPTRYERNIRTFVIQASRLIEKVSSGIAPSKSSVRLIPNFLPGETI